MLCNYALKDLAEQFNQIRANDDGITPVENFEVTTTVITLKHHHTWGCTGHILDELFQVNIARLTNW